MATAVLRAVAMNAAKGNNRAATLFTTLLCKTEAGNRKLAADAFASALDYKIAWGKELERRKKLNLSLPDPVPHPDDIILDARNMTFRVAGPLTREEVPRYRLGAELSWPMRRPTPSSGLKRPHCLTGPNATSFIEPSSQRQVHCQANTTLWAAERADEGSDRARDRGTRRRARWTWMKQTKIDPAVNVQREASGALVCLLRTQFWNTILQCSRRQS